MSVRFASTRATPERLAALTQASTTHGLCKHPSYHRWANMVDRCENPRHRAYHNYGARGIAVHPDWHDPAVFLAYLDTELGPCPDGQSIDRIDNNGDYEPGNIRWASRSEQTRNQRPRSRS